MEKRRIFFCLLAVSALLAISLIAAFAQTGGTWPSSGYDIANTRNAALENKITPANVSGLVQKWVFTTAGDVSATPAVDSQAIYFPDWGGYLYKVDKSSGKLIWKHRISDYTGITSNLLGIASFSRNGPALANGLVIFGDQASGTLLGVNQRDGSLVWMTVIESHPAAIITSSPVVYNNVVYVGVASQEESLLGFVLGYVSSFRGSVAALNASTGALLWKTYTVPDGACSAADPCYTGGGVWGSTPAVDPKRNSVYVGTGNNYTVPTAVADCITAAGDPASKLACLDPADFVDSVLSLDMTTGTIKWANKVEGPDAWYVACSFGFPCQDPVGPDFDFGSGPNLFRTQTAQGPADIVGIGQKSGVYWAVNPDTGATLWSTAVGPGSSLGGIEWGSATDGKRIYVAIVNLYGFPYGNTALGNGGSWAALDAATGTILWQVPTPGNAMGLGPMTFADGVVFAPSMSGDLVALSAATGSTLWSFKAAGSAVAGPAVVNGVVYWGTGYGRFGGVFGDTHNNQLFAFGLK